MAVLTFAFVFAFVAAPAFAQGGTQTATLAGVVTDKDGGVIPGATVTVKNPATGESLNGVTNANGGYSFPGLAAGAYKVTISLTGFKTAEIEVRLQSGSTNSITTKLEVGTISEVVTVTAGTDLVRTQTPTVTSTINSDFIQSLPRSDRTALNFLIFMPGVTTVGGAGSARSSTISGLPQNTINITIDGVSNSNLLQSGDGFFTLVGTRLDAVEEVSMTTATAGADATGQGAVQIRFQTRSGTNKFETSLYSYNKNKIFNSNSFFTRLAGLPKPEATSYVYGGRVGGPIILPGLFDGRGKAFFFFNQEESYAPSQTQRTRTLIRQSALNGDFTFNNTTPTTVNVLALAAANGQVSTYDPVIKSLLEAMRTAAATTGTITNTATSPNTSSYAWFVDVKSKRHAPTTNITVNLSPKHRLQGSYYWQRFTDLPDTLNSADPSYPGFPHYAGQTSFRTSASMSMRSTLSSSMVNEVRGGWQWSPVAFFIEEKPEQYANQGGYNVNLGFGLTNAVWGNFANAPELRNTWNWTVTDSFSWLKGAHNITMGGDFTRLINWIDDWTTVQDVTLGFDTTNDPAESMFTAANFPNSSTGDRTNARALYTLLTGRITSLPGNAAINEAGDQYIYNGHSIQRERQDEYSLFWQDQWRWKPTVTITAGLRYELQYPIIPTNGVFTQTGIADICGPSGEGTGVGGRFCNIFKPTTLGNPGLTQVKFTRYTAGSDAYKVDYNNWAPNVGVSWRPNVQSGILRKILGDPETSTISTGFSRSYIKERLDRFTNVFGSNPGATITTTRNANANGFPLVLAGESWPVLLRQTSRLGPPAFNTVPTLPLIATTSNNARIFDPNIEVPYADSWQVGLQRSLGKDMAVEVRYVGNKNKLPWVAENWNAVNIYENGLYDEFKLAQQNLRANVLAGRGGTFAYMGPGTGTSPLPITLAHFTAGMGGSAAQNAANYTSTNFTSSTFVGVLDPFFPNPSSYGNSLRSNSSGTLFNNAKAVGYPINFWQMNPLVAQSQVTRNFGGGNNHLFVVDLRRRLSEGLAAQVSYTYQRNFQLLTTATANSNSLPGTVYDLHFDPISLEQQTVPHAFKMLWTYDIPFGRGKRFGSNVAPWIDYIAGGWTFSGTGRVQQQNFILRNAVLVGMTLDEAKKALKPVRFVTDPITGALTVWNFPQDIIDNTRKAYNTDETRATFYAPGSEPTGRYFAPAGGVNCNFIYQGDCNTPELKFNGRWFGEFDFAINKAIPLPSKARFEIRAEVFNALMAKNFPNTLNPGSGANIFRMTSTQSAARTAQLVFRVTW